MDLDGPTAIEYDVQQNCRARQDSDDNTSPTSVPEREFEALTALVLRPTVVHQVGPLNICVSTSAGP
jgi:hypothetical protein